MDLERNIQNLFDDQPSEIDADNFLTKLHKTRETRLRNKQRITYGVSSLVVVMLVGIISITQLSNNSMPANYNYYLSSGEMSEDMQDQYYDELMIYLADQSDDVWSAMELYYEISNENISGE